MHSHTEATMRTTTRKTTTTSFRSVTTCNSVNSVCKVNDQHLANELPLSHHVFMKLALQEMNSPRHQPLYLCKYPNGYQKSNPPQFCCKCSSSPLRLVRPEAQHHQQPTKVTNTTGNGTSSDGDMKTNQSGTSSR